MKAVLPVETFRQAQSYVLEGFPCYCCFSLRAAASEHRGGLTADGKLFQASRQTFHLMAHEVESSALCAIFFSHF